MARGRGVGGGVSCRGMNKNDFLSFDTSGVLFEEWGFRGWSLRVGLLARVDGLLGVVFEGWWSLRGGGL